MSVEAARRRLEEARQRKKDCIAEREQHRVDYPSDPMLAQSHADKLSQLNERVYLASEQEHQAQMELDAALAREREAEQTYQRNSLEQNNQHATDYSEQRNFDYQQRQAARSREDFVRDADDAREQEANERRWEADERRREEARQKYREQMEKERASRERSDRGR